MNGKDNYPQTAELSTKQNYNMIDSISNDTPLAPPPVPMPYVKPLDKVKEPTPRKRSREREER